nr:hypothetical protein Iba_chr09bCG12750 [Ipomoea batatas]
MILQRPFSQLGIARAVEPDAAHQNIGLTRFSNLRLVKYKNAMVVAEGLLTIRSAKTCVLGAIQEVASAATAVTAAASNPLSYVHTFRISILSPRRRRYLLRNLRPSRDCRLSLSPQRGDRRRPVTAAFDRP